MSLSFGTALFYGQLTNLGFWNTAITTAEIESLNKGFSPRKVRPQNLVAFLPMVNDVIDVVKGGTITRTTDTKSQEMPRIYGVL